MVYSVATNGGSPLLALPPEIRNRIFHYALGGKTFRQIYETHRRRPFRCEPSERLHAFALLQTCRQIYAETAAVTCASSVFRIGDCYSLQNSCRSLTKYQISHITELQIELVNVKPPGAADYSYVVVNKLVPQKFAVLTELRRVRLLIFPFDKTMWDEQTLVQYEARCRLQHEDDMRSGGYELIFELMNVTFAEFHQK